MQGEDLSSARILIVDDEPVNVRLLERVLNGAGYHDLVTTTDPRTVLELYRQAEPDLVLLDLMMPHMDGLAVLAQLRAERPDGAFVPVLVLTADATEQAKRTALEAGANDFLTKPFEHFEVLLRIRNLLDTRRAYLALEGHNRALEATVRERTAQLLQSEKVAAMGALLAGVAHELNNPLAVLSGHAQLLLDDAIPAVVHRASRIHNAADRCVRIVRNFLALARQHPPERGETRVRQLIDSALELVAYELRTDGISVDVEVADDLPLLWADPHQLHQVFVNLVTNAHHAMRKRPGPRRLVLSARRDPASAAVRLEIADTGPGMPPDVQARIFEPFFTTKPVGEGTGLGLSLCRGIIEEHGGTIAVESVPEEGTRFIIILPVVSRPAAEAAAAAAATPRPVIRPGRVLVVDDEAAIAELIADALQRDGHQADTAPHGSAALDMLAHAAYDVIVTDTKMPGMDGQAFYEELGRRFPALQQQVIFVTGDVLSREKREFLEATGAPALAKPCNLAELRRLVADVARRGSSEPRQP